jgi:hypothetical protein
MVGREGVTTGGIPRAPEETVILAPFSRDGSPIAAESARGIRKMHNNSNRMGIVRIMVFPPTS